MSWIRIDRGIANDPKISRISKALKKEGATIVGYLVLIFAEMAVHAKDGNIEHVDDWLLEKWAGWSGRKGAFAACFRSEFAPAGTVTAWHKHNGAAIEKAENDARRLRDKRATDARASRVSGATDAGTRRDETRRDGRTTLTPPAREAFQEILPKLVSAANSGLADHEDPARRQDIPRITLGSKSSLEGAQALVALGIPDEDLERLVYEAAKTHRGKGTMCALSYFVGMVKDAWDREQTQQLPRTKPDSWRGERSSATENTTAMGTPIL